MLWAGVGVQTPATALSGDLGGSGDGSAVLGRPFAHPPMERAGVSGPGPGVSAFGAKRLSDRVAPSLADMRQSGIPFKRRGSARRS